MYEEIAKLKRVELIALREFINEKIITDTKYPKIEPGKWYEDLSGVYFMLGKGKSNVLLIHPENRDHILRAKLKQYTPSYIYLENLVLDNRPNIKCPRVVSKISYYLMGEFNRKMYSDIEMLLTEEI